MLFRGRYLQVPCAGSKLEASAGSQSGKYFAAAQHDARIALPSCRPRLIEVFEDLDRQIATDAATVLEGRCGECAVGRAVGELARDFRESCKGLGQKEPVIGDPGDPAQPLGAAEEALDRFGRKPERDGQLTNSRRPEIRGGEQRVNTLPEPLIRPGQPRLVLGQTPYRALAHDAAGAGKSVERRLERRLGSRPAQLRDQYRPARPERVRLRPMPGAKPVDNLVAKRR